MLGRLDPLKRNVRIVGAGIAGLLMARRLDQLGYTVSLYESGDRLGGMIRTVRSPYGISEAAANSMLASSPVLELCRELGISLQNVNPQSHARYIFRDGKPRKMPLKLKELFDVLKRAVRKNAETPPENLDRLDQWAEHFLGSAASDYLVSPFVRGIYGCSPRDLSVAAGFPTLRIPIAASLFSHFRSIKRNRTPGPRPKMVAPTDGMQSIVDELGNDVQRRLRDRVQLNTSIGRDEIQAWSVTDNVVLAVPAGVASGLLGTTEGPLGESLSKLKYTPLVSATIFLKKSDFISVPRGVGVLIPEVEAKAVSSILGILFSSSSFEGRVVDSSNTLSLTVILHGRLINADDSLIAESIRTDLHRIFCARGYQASTWLHQEIHRWPRAIPVYNDSLKQVWALADQTWCQPSGKILFANYTGQVSIRAMIEKVASLEG